MIVWHFLTSKVLNVDLFRICRVPCKNQVGAYKRDRSFIIELLQEVSQYNIQVRHIINS
jgi:hypothetical protein